MAEEQKPKKTDDDDVVITASGGTPDPFRTVRLQHYRMKAEGGHIGARLGN